MLQAACACLRVRMLMDFSQVPNAAFKVGAAVAGAGVANPLFAPRVSFVVAQVSLPHVN